MMSASLYFLVSINFENCNVSVFNHWYYAQHRQKKYINGLAQDCSNSIANALELLQSCAEPSIYTTQTLLCFVVVCSHHYSNVIMSATACQTTSVSIVYSTVCSGAHQRKYQYSAHPARAMEVLDGLHGFGGLSTLHSFMECFWLHGWSLAIQLTWYPKDFLSYLLCRDHAAHDLFLTVLVE